MSKEEELQHETVKYTESDIKTVSWDEHIRRRPGMYIGKLGDGSAQDDGIYVLLKEVIDNSIDEYVMGNGKVIEITIAEGRVSVRDYGRGIPLGSLQDAVAKMNTGAKIDSKAFKKSVGLNGVGLKAVNALSSEFVVQSRRDKSSKRLVFNNAALKEDSGLFDCDEANGVEVSFVPNNQLFRNYKYQDNFVIALLRNYTFLNAGLTIVYNGQKYYSRNGLLDLLKDDLTSDPLYPVIHFKGDDIEVAITHVNQYGEEFYSFVNGQYTTQGGTHLSAFREAVARVIKEHYQKNFEYSDIRSGIAAAISIKVIEPTFESQTKTKLGSKDMVPETKDYENEPFYGMSIQRYVGEFLKEHLDDYLHINSETSEILLKKIQESEHERKAMSGVTKIARERAKKVSLHNTKLAECKAHLTDQKSEYRELSSIFITEGDSASGSIKKVRNPEYQAIFSLKGKPLNTFGMTRKVVYENEEFNLLQAALNIEDSIENLRYNRVIIATDADDDGMHIRLLILTFFLNFFPDLIRKGHVFIFETPLFKVALPPGEIRSRKKKKTDEVYTYYCYDEEERDLALNKLGKKAKITRFKGLGEISPSEFKELIAEETIQLRQVTLRKEDAYKDMLSFYMGKNTPERCDFIIENLIIDEEEV